MIIQGDRITCAGAVFPTSSSSKLNKRLGTRHRAAVGITEETDCIALVVSEETGRMSIAIKGELFYNLTIDDVRMMLIDELRPKQDSLQDEDDYEDEPDVKIVRTKKFGVKPMNPEEACVQMELLQHNFYVFLNSETDEVNVVYKRKNNTYGLIEPELD